MYPVHLCHFKDWCMCFGLVLVLFFSEGIFFFRVQIVLSTYLFCLHFLCCFFFNSLSLLLFIKLSSNNQQQSTHLRHSFTHPTFCRTVICIRKSINENDFHLIMPHHAKEIHWHVCTRNKMKNRLFVYSYFFFFIFN